MPQIGIRFSDDQLAAIDGAIRRVHLVDDALGQRSDYVRDAALVAAQVETHNRSLQTITRRYLEMCRRSRPKLEPAEWRLICDVLNGTWLLEGHERFIAHEISDGIALNQVDKKWNVDGKALLDKLSALDYAGCCAVVDVVERFWGADNSAVPGEDGWSEDPAR